MDGGTTELRSTPAAEEGLMSVQPNSAFFFTNPSDPENSSAPESTFPREEADAETLSEIGPQGDEPRENLTAEINKAAKRDNADAAMETATDATTESDKQEEKLATPSGIVVSSSKKSRPPYKFDPEKITLRFLFANRDGLTVTVECKPSDTVGEVKGALISVWPEGT